MNRFLPLLLVGCVWIDEKDMNDQLAKAGGSGEWSPNGSYSGDLDIAIDVPVAGELDCEGTLELTVDLDAEDRSIDGSGECQASTDTDTITLAVTLGGGVEAWTEDYPNAAGLIVIKLAGSDSSHEDNWLGVFDEDELSGTFSGSGAVGPFEALPYDGTFTVTR